MCILLHMLYELEKDLEGWPYEAGKALFSRKVGAKQRFHHALFPGCRCETVPTCGGIEVRVEKLLWYRRTYLCARYVQGRRSKIRRAAANAGVATRRQSKVLTKPSPWSGKAIGSIAACCPQPVSPTRKSQKQGRHGST